MSEQVISLVEQSNMLIAAFDKKDQEFDSIIDKVMSATESLTSDEVKSNIKYDIIVGIEYLLVRARLVVESESLKVKRIISSNNSDLSPSIKGLFVKRDTYLAQVSMKLNSIRDEIANLQKVVYCGSNFIRK